MRRASSASAISPSPMHAKSTFGFCEDVVGQRLRVMAADEDRLAERLLELLGHLRRERPEVRERADRDEVRVERLRALEQRLVAVHPREMRRLQEEVVVETRVEDQVDLVPWAFTIDIR
jgi:hypothetical protein